MVGHLEYLNTLNKDSYKDDAKSAQTAKLRSLTCYYFFIAENEGIVGNLEVEINRGNSIACVKCLQAAQSTLLA